jgi:hypothetical protein
MFSIIPPYLGEIKKEIRNINWDKYINFINSFNKKYREFDKILIKYNITDKGYEVYFLQYNKNYFLRRYEIINANIDQIKKEFEYFIII